jgi:hypothetical protein
MFYEFGIILLHFEMIFFLKDHLMDLSECQAPPVGGGRGRPAWAEPWFSLLKVKLRERRNYYRQADLKPYCSWQFNPVTFVTIV